MKLIIKLCFFLIVKSLLLLIPNISFGKQGYFKPKMFNASLSLVPYDTDPTGKTYDFKHSFLVKQVELGFTDSFHFLVADLTHLWKIPEFEEYTSVSSGKHKVVINKGTWPYLAKSSQDVYLDFLFKKYYSITALKATIAGSDVLPQENLTPFASNWAGKVIKKNIPNCYFAAIASVVPNLGRGRNMKSSEFACYMNRGFKHISTPDQNIGDIVVFIGKTDLIEHAATYVGHNELDINDKIYLTKNGKTPGKYMFMSLSVLVDIYGDGRSNFRQYRRVQSYSDEELIDICDRDSWGWEH